MLFFHFELKWKSYGHFKILKLSLFEIKILKWENGHNSLILAQNEKITPLSFIQLLKLKARKWCHFFHFELKWKSYGHFYVSQLNYKNFEFSDFWGTMSKVDIHSIEFLKVIPQSVTPMYLHYEGIIFIFDIFGILSHPNVS